MFRLRSSQPDEARADDAAAVASPELGASAPSAGREPSTPPIFDVVSHEALSATQAQEQYLELIGTHLRASGVVQLGRFRRLTDYVNLLDGFFGMRDVVLLTRTGEPTRITMPELRVRLDDVAIVGQLVNHGVPPSTEYGVQLAKVERRLVIMTRAHIIYGYVHLIDGGSIMGFLDAADPKFIPMSQVRVRWLADRRLAARYPFALVQRSLVLGVAGEGTGAPREARARRKAAVEEALRESWGEFAGILQPDA